MRFYAQSNYACCTLIPTISAGTVQCGNPECNEVHGLAISLTFLFWSAGIIFARGLS